MTERQISKISAQSPESPGQAVFSMNHPFRKKRNVNLSQNSLTSTMKQCKIKVLYQITNESRQRFAGKRCVLKRVRFDSLQMPVTAESNFTCGRFSIKIAQTAAFHNMTLELLFLLLTENIGEM